MTHMNVLVLIGLTRVRLRIIGHTRRNFAWKWQSSAMLYFQQAV